jgi:hypothetical protein
MRYYNAKQIDSDSKGVWMLKATQEGAYVSQKKDNVTIPFDRQKWQ